MAKVERRRWPRENLLASASGAGNIHLDEMPPRRCRAGSGDAIGNLQDSLPRRLRVLPQSGARGEAAKSTGELVIVGPAGLDVEHEIPDFGPELFEAQRRNQAHHVPDVGGGIIIDVEGAIEHYSAEAGGQAIQYLSPDVAREVPEARRCHQAH